MSNRKSVTWQAISSEIWDAVRKTGQVTSDGADECTDAAMASISRVLFSEEFKGLESLSYTLGLLRKQQTRLQSKLQSKEIERSASGKKFKKELVVIENSINLFGGLFSEAARERILQIRSEIEKLAASKANLEALRNNGLMDKAAVVDSLKLHDEKIEKLEAERAGLYKQFPELSDMQKAD